MHTRSKNKITGKFIATVWDWNGAECVRGEFDTHTEADRAAEREERAMTLRMLSPEPALTIDEIMISDDDLLRELEA